MSDDIDPARRASCFRLAKGATITSLGGGIGGGNVSGMCSILWPILICTGRAQVLVVGEFEGAREGEFEDILLRRSDALSHFFQVSRINLKGFMLQSARAEVATLAALRRVVNIRPRRKSDEIAAWQKITQMLLN